MSSKHENPYDVQSNYGRLFAFLRSKQVVKKADMIAEAVKLGLSDKPKEGAKSSVSAADASVTVIMSPRHPDAVRNGADCRGNASAAGHLYYMEILEGKRFRLRWREVPLEPKARKGAKAKEVKEVVAKGKSPAKKSPAKKAPAKKTSVTPEVTPESAQVANPEATQTTV